MFLYLKILFLERGKKRDVRNINCNNVLCVEHFSESMQALACGLVLRVMGALGTVTGSDGCTGQGHWI